MAHRSKCKTIDCCGIKCERDVQGEEALDAQQQICDIVMTQRFQEVQELKKINLKRILS